MRCPLKRAVRDARGRAALTSHGGATLPSRRRAAPSAMGGKTAVNRGMRPESGEEPGSGRCSLAARAANRPPDTGAEGLLMGMRGSMRGGPDASREAPGEPRGARRSSEGKGAGALQGRYRGAADDSFDPLPAVHTHALPPASRIPLALRPGPSGHEIALHRGASIRVS